MPKLITGTQIIYVPTHTDGDLAHPDCEEGFVTSVRGDNAFCRYWSKHTPNSLRTKAGSELTPISLLVIKDTMPQEMVDDKLEAILWGTT